MRKLQQKSGLWGGGGLFVYSLLLLLLGWFCCCSEVGFVVVVVVVVIFVFGGSTCFYAHIIFTHFFFLKDTFDKYQTHHKSSFNISRRVVPRFYNFKEIRQIS